MSVNDLLKSNSIIPKVGTYSGRLTRGAVEVTATLLLAHDPVIAESTDPDDPIHYNHPFVASLLFWKEGGPYICYNVNFDLDRKSMVLRYSRSSPTHHAALDTWDLMFRLVFEFTSNSFKGQVESRSRGNLGQIELSFSAGTSLVPAPAIVGTWEGFLERSSKVKLPVRLALQPGQRAIENPWDHELGFTASKIGVVEIAGWAFLLPSITIDYLTNRVHFVHKSAESGPRLQLVGSFDNDLTMELDVFSSIGKIGKSTLKRIE